MREARVSGTAAALVSRLPRMDFVVVRRAPASGIWLEFKKGVRKHEGRKAADNLPEIYVQTDRQTDRQTGRSQAQECHHAT